MRPKTTNGLRFTRFYSLPTVTFSDSTDATVDDRSSTVYLDPGAALKIDRRGQRPATEDSGGVLQRHALSKSRSARHGRSARSPKESSKQAPFPDDDVDVFVDPLASGGVGVIGRGGIRSVRVSENCLNDTSVNIEKFESDI